MTVEHNQPQNHPYCFFKGVIEDSFSESFMDTLDVIIIIKTESRNVRDNIHQSTL